MFSLPFRAIIFTQLYPCFSSIPSKMATTGQISQLDTHVSLTMSGWPGWPSHTGQLLQYQGASILTLFVPTSSNCTYFYRHFKTMALQHKVQIPHGAHNEF